MFETNLAGWGDFMAAKFYKGIRTLYGGVWFRSRLEASWATYFDASGIRWKYEPQTFKLGDYGSYRPDFQISLNGRELFVEIKPRKKMVSLDQWVRIHQFVKQWRKALVMAYGKPGPGPFTLEEFSKPVGGVLLTVSKAF